MSQAADLLEHIDTVSERLAQASGVVASLMNTYDARNGMHTLPAEHLQNTLWALDALLDQARDACSAFQGLGDTVEGEFVVQPTPLNGRRLKLVERGPA